MERLIAVVLTSIAVSSLAVYPHSLSYFNEIAGGPLRGPAHLLDANIDWGQDLFELKRWQLKNPELQPLLIACTGGIKPQAIDLKAELLHFQGGRILRSGSLSEKGQALDWYALSVNTLYGNTHGSGDSNPLFRFQGRKPTAHAGYGIYIYQLPRADAFSGGDFVPRNSLREN
jgi:hypothetical protein